MLALQKFSLSWAVQCRRSWSWSGRVVGEGQLRRSEDRGQILQLFLRSLCCRSDFFLKRRQRESFLGQNKKKDLPQHVSCHQMSCASNLPRHFTQAPSDSAPTLHKLQRLCGFDGLQCYCTAACGCTSDLYMASYLFLFVLVITFTYFTRVFPLSSL